MLTIRKLVVGVLFSLAAFGIAPAWGEARIGVYDSRSLALAYAGTEMFAETLQELRSKHEAAEAAGDAELTAKLDEEGRAMQHKMHLQGFSTAPVDEIIALIADELAEIMEKHAVSAIVSKWDEARLAEYPRADQVDVTMDLVDALHPNERQRRFAEEVQTKRPMRLEKAKKKLGQEGY